MSRLGRIAGRVAASQPVKARKLVELLLTQRGSTAKANWTGAWDRVEVDGAKVVTVNRGKGFEDAVAVSTAGGHMVYMEPFTVENMPTAGEMLLFHCTDGLFVKWL